MMSDRDFKNYTDLFDLMISLVKLPDLMIYIKSSIPTLVKHIEKRGRDFEKSIRIDYLQGLNKRYEDWIKDYKGRLIIIDGDNLEFGENPEDFRKVTDLIDAELFVELDGYCVLEGDNIEVYDHMNKHTLCTMVQLNENNEEAGHKVAMQVAAMRPVALDESSVSEETKKTELEVAVAKTKEELVEKAVNAALSTCFNPR